MSIQLDAFVYKSTLGADLVVQRKVQLTDLGKFYTYHDWEKDPTSRIGIRAGSVIRSPSGGTPRQWGIALATRWGYRTGRRHGLLYTYLVGPTPRPCSSKARSSNWRLRPSLRRCGGILRNFSLQCASPAMMWDLAVAAASGAWSVADPESAVDTLMALTPGSSDKQDAEADAHMGEEEDDAEPSDPREGEDDEEEATEMVDEAEPSNPGDEAEEEAGEMVDEAAPSNPGDEADEEEEAGEMVDEAEPSNPGDEAEEEAGEMVDKAEPSNPGDEADDEEEAGEMVDEAEPSNPGDKAEEEAGEMVDEAAPSNPGDEAEEEEEAGEMVDEAEPSNPGDEAEEEAGEMVDEAAPSNPGDEADDEEEAGEMVDEAEPSNPGDEAEEEEEAGEMVDEAEPSNPGDEAEEEEEAGEMVVTQYQGIGKLGKLLDNNMAEAAARRKKLWIRRMHQLRSLSAHIQGVRHMAYQLEAPFRERARHMAYQLEAPFREAVSAFLASPSPGSFFKGVPIVAWRGLQAATALRQLSLLNLTDRLSKEPLDIDLVGRGPDAPQDEAVLKEEAVLKRLQETEPWLLAIPQSLDELSQEMQAGEVELLQVHVWYSLSKGLDASIGGGGEALGCKVPKRQLAPVEGAAGAQAGEATAEHPLWRLLMADWVSLNMRQLQQHADELLGLAATDYAIWGLQQHADELLGLAATDYAIWGLQQHADELLGLAATDYAICSLQQHADELLRLAATVYVICGLQAPMNTQPPSREPIPSPCDDEILMCGGPLDSASSAIGSVDGIPIKLPRCSSSMMVCASSNVWHCHGYQDPPFNRLDGTPDVPFCLFCGVRLGARAPNQFLQMPALEVVALPPEPVTFD
eukprot:gene3864-13927_t